MCATGPYGENQNWMLVKREIPQLEEKLMRLSKIRKHTGVENPSNFIKGEKLTIPANSECSFILDNDFLTNAYVHFVSSRGKGSVVKVTYAEALFDKNGKKGNRNSIEGRDFSNSAPFDVFMPDGGTKRDFSTLWFRTYRYVSVDIKTADEPLDIEDFYGVFTGYPFKEKGSFETSDKSLSDIWNVGWRTARLCAVETYFDCPYYEQLQYVGDTRIQALISLYVSGDDRLARQAISNFDYSRGSDGLVKSRYPTRVKQYIPPVCSLLGFNARRFCKAPRRPAICKRTFRWSAGSIRLVLQTNRPKKRHAPPDAKPLEFCRLGDYMEARLRAGIGKRRFGDKFFALCIRSKKCRQLNALYGLRARSRRIRPKEPRNRRCRQKKLLR